MDNRESVVNTNSNFSGNKNDFDPNNTDLDDSLDPNEKLKKSKKSVITEQPKSTNDYVFNNDNNYQSGPMTEDTCCGCSSQSCWYKCCADCCNDDGDYYSHDGGNCDNSHDVGGFDSCFGTSNGHYDGNDLHISHDVHGNHDGGHWDTGDTGGSCHDYDGGGGDFGGGDSGGGDCGGGSCD